MDNFKQYLNQIAKDIIKNNDLEDITIQFKNVRRGSARGANRQITIPIWAIQRHRAFGMYYIIHEVCHFIVNDKFGFGYGHGKMFKELEIITLEKYYMKPIYKKAYVKYLTDLNGNKLCGDYGREIISDWGIDLEQEVWYTYIDRIKKEGDNNV